MNRTTKLDTVTNIASRLIDLRAYRASLVSASADIDSRIGGSGSVTGITVDIEGPLATGTYLRIGGDPQSTAESHLRLRFGLLPEIKKGVDREIMRTDEQIDELLRSFKTPPFWAKKK